MSLLYPPSSRRAFTLIELLAVVAVMAMILAFVGPSIGNMGAGRRLDNGGNALVNSINYARQLAKSERRLTALVLIKETDQTEKISRRFTIIQQNPDLTAWVQVTRWESMPEAVVVDEDESEDFFTHLPSVQPALPTLRRGGVNHAPTGYVYQVFLPTGGLLTTSTAPEPPELTIRGFPKAAAGDNLFKIIINPNTGSPVINRP